MWELAGHCAPSRDGLWPGERRRRAPGDGRCGAGEKREKVVASDSHSQTLCGMKVQNGKMERWLYQFLDSWSVQESDQWLPAPSQMQPSGPARHWALEDSEEHKLELWTHGLVGFCSISQSKRQICSYLACDVTMTSAKRTALPRASTSVDLVSTCSPERGSGQGIEPHPLPFLIKKKKKKTSKPEILSKLTLALGVKAWNSHPWKMKSNKYCADVIWGILLFLFVWS